MLRLMRSRKSAIAFTCSVLKIKILLTAHCSGQAAECDVELSFSVGLSAWTEVSE